MVNPDRYNARSLLQLRLKAGRAARREVGQLSRCLGLAVPPGLRRHHHEKRLLHRNFEVREELLTAAGSKSTMEPKDAIKRMIELEQRQRQPKEQQQLVPADDVQDKPL